LFIINRLDHLATPLNSNLTKYSTRRNSQGLVDFIHEPEKVYKRRLAKLASHRILDQLTSESIFYIHLLFDKDSSLIFNFAKVEMDDYFRPLDFSAINGYPHVILEKTIEKLPYFQGNNAITAKAHNKAFSLCINKWCSGATHNHQDIKMKFFALSLEEYASNWFSSLDDNKYATIKDLIARFMERWGDKKKHRHLLATLHSIKKNENENMEEFNKKINELVTSLHIDYKPPTASILIYYIEAFNGEMRYQLRDKEPTNLKVCKK
jgi:hypothetical protein